MVGSRQPSLPLGGLPDAGELAESVSVRRVSLHFQQKKNYWICLYFNKLPLEVISDAQDNPKAIIETDGRQARILLCDEVAVRFGVRPGMRVNAALALLPGLELVTREAARESKALERLAAWALRYTPAVNIDAEGALLLEVRASLKMFGGLPALRRLIMAELAAQPHQAMLSSASTAVAAWWLARAGQADLDTDDPAAIDTGFTARLMTLPIHSFGWPDKTVQTLAQMGVRTFGDCVRLPRDGFARRIGVERLRDLDRALGLESEVCEFYQPPQHFSAMLELADESTDAGLLLESARILLHRLDAFLTTRQGGMDILWIRLHHFDQPVTLLRIGLMRSVTESSGLLELIRLRFDDLHSVAPVTALAFDTHLVPASGTEEADLFGDRVADGRQALGLYERLRARLGVKAVHGIDSVPEHRPEAAWETVAPAEIRDGARDDKFIFCRRPLWILDDPQPLQIVSGKPVLHEALDFESGPERIETGWWDGKDIRRDYYVVRNRRGTRFWIFQDCRASGWFLHGLFG